MMTVMASCVHEWPENLHPEREVRLNIHHRLDWSESLEIEVTRAAQPSQLARYHMMVCEAGNPSNQLAVSEFTTTDLTRADFTTSLHLQPGNYDLWVWSDWADTNGKSLCYESSDFSHIHYPEPYRGGNEMRDALRGMTSFTIDDNYLSDYSIDIDLTLERPLARYEFISTDLNEFIDNETSRGLMQYPSFDAPSRLPEMDNYTVKMIYSGYMPSEFDNFQNKPVNSTTGVSYTARIRPISDDEALLGFDYVMVNGHESSIPVAMELYDPEGTLIGRTNPIDVPTQRNRCTIVRGKFLTSKATGGVGINPDFNGDFNIEIR